MACAPGSAFDLAVLDLQMPGHGRADAGRRDPQAARRQRHAVGAAGARWACSAEQPENAALPLPSCLAKPIKPAQLAQALVRAMSGAQARPPSRGPRTAKLDPTTGRPAATARAAVRRQRHQPESRPAIAPADGLSSGPGRQWPGSPGRPGPSALRPDFHGRDDAGDGRAWRPRA